MPEVKYKTKGGMKTKHFSYTKKGMKDAKQFAKLSGGNMSSRLNDVKMKYAKKKG